MTKISIPNFEAVDADVLSELLANIIKAVDDVETARNLFQSIASNRKPLSQMDSRNAIALHDAMNVAEAAQDDACRHLADRCTQLRDLLNPQNRSRKTKVPDAYADFYYLRDIDLRAERLGDYPFHLSLEQCQEFYDQGWLFHTREDALRVREAMRRAYVNGVMAVKGADNILFNRPLRP